jgi:hypothetical protein
MMQALQSSTNSYIHNQKARKPAKDGGEGKRPGPLMWLIPIMCRSLMHLLIRRICMWAGATTG